MSYISGDTQWKFTMSDPLYDAPSGKIDQLGIPNTHYAPESDNFLPRTGGQGANAPSENLGFYLAGMWNENGAKFTYPAPPKNRSTSLIKVNTVNQGHADWQIYPLNETMTPWRAEGGLVWVPSSTHGLLVAIGGVISPADMKVRGNHENATVSHEFLKTFPVYDIGSDTWANQPLDTNSQFPDLPLAQFCTIVASNKDGTQHDIFVYGGSDGNLTLPNSDVWILSIPSFTWIKADIGERAGVARQRHTCISPYPDTMMVIGGTDLGGFALASNQAVDVYNLNTLNWTGVYDPDPETHQEYQRNSAIEDIVSKRPIADNINPLIAGWFDQKYTMEKIKFYGPYLRTVPETPPAGNNTIPPPPAQTHSDRSWVVPVAAAVSAGSVVLIMGIAFFLWRRKKRLEHEDEKSTDPNRPKSWIVPWVWAVQQSHKEVGSDTVTEVDPGPKSPHMSPLPQELHGEGYFGSSVTDRSSHQRWSSTTPARSPPGNYVGPVEGPDNPVLEVEDRTAPIDRINYDIRVPAMYPPSVVGGGNHEFTSTGSHPSTDDQDHLHFGPLGNSPPLVPSSSRGFVVDTEGHDGFGPLDPAVSPFVDRSNQRPRHRRHNSSVSSGMSLPSPGEQSPQSAPRTTRSLSGEHNIATSPAEYDRDVQQGNYTA